MAIAVSQAALVPTTVVNLAANASYVVSHFATNCAALSSGMKLQISQDAIAISKVTPTSVTFTGHQSVKGVTRTNHQFAVSRVQAVYRSLVAQLKNLGVPRPPSKRLESVPGSPSSSW